MTEAVAAFHQPADRAAPRAWHFALALGLAWLLLCAQLLGMYWQQSAWTMPDADDAMRLVQMREFLAGHGWFDLHEPRLGPPVGYDSHWSRLIDAGLAGLYLLYRAFTGPEFAERLMAVTWPMLWLVFAMAGAAAITWRIGGRNAALVALVLVAFCGPGMQQFRPGRIDHHNVHIALAILAVAATVWSDRSSWACWAAGGLAGLALAIGFEGLPFSLACGVAFGLRYVLNSRAADSLRHYGLALSGGALVAFLASVPPSRWTMPVCDMIAANWALAVAIAGFGLAGVATLRHQRWTTRALAMMGTGALASAVFVAIEPRCLGGVFAMMDPAIRPIWLDHVSETKPLTDLIARAGASGLGVAAFPLVALMALAYCLTDRERLKDYGSLAASAMFLLSVIYMLTASRGVSYAVWLGIPFVAAAAMAIFQARNWTSLPLRFAAVLVLTPTAITIGAVVLASALGAKTLDINSATRQACVRHDNFATLAELPKGLVAVNELEWGPYVLAWSPHDVLAAPYHRAPAGIIASYAIFHQPPEQARRTIRDAHVEYLFVCGDEPSNLDRFSLLGQIGAGHVPDWLTPVRLGSPSIYRVGS